MSGDRPGSPRRDERQSFAPEEPWSHAAPAAAETPRPAEPFPLGQAVPSGDDIKVAGPQYPQAPAGDTLGFQPVATGEPAIGTGAMASPGMGAPGMGTELLDAAGESRDEVAFGAGSEPAPRSSGPRRLGGSRSSRRSSGPKGGGRNGLKIAAVVAGAVVVVGGGGAAAFAMTGGSGDGGAKTVQPKLADAAAAPKVDPMVMEQMRRKEAYERASRATREDPVKGPKLRVKGHPIPKPTPTKSKDSGSGSGGPSGDPVPAGEAQQIAKKLLPSYGMSGSGQFGCLVNLWNKESHWNTHAANPSGAYGIPQALPGSKMASAGPDWQNSATTQIKWGLGYIKDRYSTPCGAWSHSESSGWY
ncbi:aggregation-promoting factor C-terminal-like domain-containing protein [Actinomadura napierensis]|uniref:Lytic transglycosylase domain-containing protein n=1 Tax=Actinomadura napierensis TaxID=267854 RepID=A0ABP5KVZ7_9ACTN